MNDNDTATVTPALIAQTIIKARLRGSVLASGLNTPPPLATKEQKEAFRDRMVKDAALLMLCAGIIEELANLIHDTTATIRKLTVTLATPPDHDLDA